MSGLDIKTRLTVLNTPKDFLSWKVDLRVHLKAKKLWNLTEGTRQRPSAKSEEFDQWNDDNDKALAEIMPILGPPYKAQHQTVDDAAQLWEAIVTQHESKGFVQRYNLLLEIPRLTIGQCNNDVNAYCNRLAKLRDEQIVANGSMHQGDNFTSNQLVTFFVGGLQGLPRWEQFVLNLRQKEKLPSLDEVMSLARDEHRLHKTLGSTPDTAIVLSAQSTKRSKKPYHKNQIGHCTIHPRSNHADEDCFVQHPEKKHDRATKGSGSVADPRATMFSISTPVHTLSAVTSSSLWAVDSGANEHCCNTSQLLFNVQPILPPVTIHGATGAYTCTLQGSLQLDLSLPNGGVQLITLKRVLYVPDLPINLLSSNHFRAKGVYFSNLDCTFRRVSDNKPFGHAPIHNGLNILQLAESQSTAPTPVGLLASFDPRSSHKDSSARSTALPNGIAASPSSTVSPIPSPSDRASPVTSRSDDQADLWHRRLGHPSITTMRTIQAATPGLPHVPFKQLQPCEVCQLAKSTRQVSRTPQRRARQPLEKIHIDLVGRIQPQSSQGHNYVTVITDDYSRYRWTFSTPVKGDAHQIVVNFVQWTQVHCSPFHIQVIRIDQGKEFGVTALRTLCERESIDLEYSAAYTPEQNGIAEASNKVLLTKARAMMLDGGLPQRMWTEALMYATYIVNRSITQRSQLASPQQMFWQAIRNDETKNDLTHLRRFGCAVYYHRPSSQTVKSQKFAARAVRGYLLGMQADSTTNYRIWLPESQTILHTPHVTFNETASYKDHVEHEAGRTGNNTIQTTVIESETRSNQGVPLPSEASVEPTSHSPFAPSGGDNDIPEGSLESIEDTPDDGLSDTITIAPDSVSPTLPNPDPRSTDSDDTILVQLPTDAHDAPMGRVRRDVPPVDYRALHRGYLAQALAAQTLDDTPVTIREPCSYQAALAGPQSPHWLASMQREIHQLEAQRTWALVLTLPPGRVLIKGRWVFKIKRNPDHTIREYKSRWVAKGFMQEEGVDYFDTYAATLRAATFRTIFALVAFHGWPLYQVDVNGAFLHSLLQDDIYMEAPHGFYDGQICKLLKSLYGLKQAPYLWYQALAKALEALGFLCLHADHCCFTNADRDVFVLVFVDDIQITGPNVTAIETLRDGLKATFSLRELEAQTFLGLQIERDPTKRRLRLHQKPYAEKVLQDFGFRDSKPVATPMLEQNLIPHEGPVKLNRQKWYRQAVGSLNHLAVSTRPDLAFSMSRLSRYLDNPSPQHEIALKRVFRYLNGTTGHGLTFQASENEPFVYGYSDADWAGDVETRKSTSGYAFFVAGALVSWRTRLQSIVTLSSTEAEYAALSETLREAAWLRSLLTEIGFDEAQLIPLPIFEDNQSAIKLATNHANSNRTKHIDVRNHFCRQEHNMGHVTIEYVPTDSQVADGFTKPLGSTKWKHFLSLLRLAQSSANNPKAVPVL